MASISHGFDDLSFRSGRLDSNCFSWYISINLGLLLYGFNSLGNIVDAQAAKPEIQRLVDKVRPVISGM